MNRSRTLATILAALSASLIPSRAEALANRVFVSARSGNNANACDNINTPCQTFAGAVVQLNPGGEAIVLDSGGYGPVTITQSLTIEAPPGVLAFIHPPAGDAITVNAGVSDVVVLRGLVLNGGGGPGNGIIVNTAGTVYIENCVISGFSSITGSGIFVDVAGSKLFVKDTISRQNGTGANFASGRASIDHCRFEGNLADGVLVQGADVTIRDSVSAGNGSHGFEVFAHLALQNGVLSVYECMSTNNGVDGFSAGNTGTGSVIARVANSSISENVALGLQNTGGSVTFFSLGNNFVEGNLLGATVGTITVVPH